MQPVNVLPVTKLYHLKWLILCDANFTSIKKIKSTIKSKTYSRFQANEFAALHTVCTEWTILARGPQKSILGESRSIWRVEKEAAPSIRARFQFQGIGEVWPPTTSHDCPPPPGKLQLGKVTAHNVRNRWWENWIWRFTAMRFELHFSLEGTF